ncbi:MAG: hypothetical protein J0M12_11860 [Deltaproteobacteria bacterium]|nr:hypothetical protein [Deltaproteobacteria bacterium]
MLNPSFSSSRSFSFGLKFLTVLWVTALSIFTGSEAFAAPQESKTFVTESKGLLQSGVTSKISFKIKRPRAPKGATLDKGIQIKGCWLGDSFKSLTAKDAANKKIKFKISKDGSALEFKKILTVKYPIKATLNFSGPLAVQPRASRVAALGQTACLTVKKKNGTTKRDCSEVQPVSVYGVISGVACQNATDLEENHSAAQIVFANGDEFTIRPRTQALAFSMLGGTFNADLTDATVILNDVAYVAPDVQLSGGILTLNAPLLDGLNKVRVLALDSEGLQAKGEFSFWAGSYSLTVLMRTATGQVVDSGQLTMRIADDPAFFRAVNFSAGQAVFNDLPGTTVSLSALSSDGLSGFSAGAGSDVTTTVTMLPLLDESPVDNNDISKGLEGWAIGSGAPVGVVPHSEDGSGPLFALQQGAEPPTGNDQDLVLRTSGEGPRFMTRTFRTDPRSRLVKIRYRFQTSEYPGGYFGSKYNDFYNVALRSSQGSHILDDGSSMNALGRAAFSPSGYTVWKSTVIPVNRNKSSQSTPEVVQASVVVANVADGAYDSRVVVDKIEESSFAITDAKLFDIDNGELQFLSAETHPYFGGFTRINGTITLEGDADDKVTEVYLQLMDAGVQVAKAQLSTQAASKILNKKFGKSGVIAIKSPMLLFKIFPKELVNLATETDRGFSLVIQAKTAQGQTAHSSVGTVRQLVRYTGASRYDGRDETEGGDDWLLPSVREIVNQISAGRWGDFSNMNGGRFPPHSMHQTGRSADGWVEGYNALNADTAESLISLLNSGLGSRIRFMYVRFNRNPGNAFYQAIAGRTLTNGRRVDRVILPDSEHDTHFHLEF